MLVPRDHVLVALSGGPDSVALLGGLAALSSRLRIRLCAAHFNHQLRGAESLADALCAATAAEQLGVPLVVERSDSLRGAANLEARARDERYAFLERAAAAQGCTKIATGHTLDDQAETVLMRLLRGTGGEGLAAIRAVRDGRIIRPLLDCSRDQVMAFLRSAGLPFCHDRSNDDRRFLRNRVRHEVVPLLRTLQPNVARRLAATAATLAAESHWLEEQGEGFLRPWCAADESLDIGAFVQAPPVLRPHVARAWLRARRGDLRGLTAAHVHAVVALALGGRPNAHLRLPRSLLIVREYDRLHVRAGDGGPCAVTPVLLGVGAVVELASGWRIRADVAAPGPLDAHYLDLWSVVADADVVGLPVLVRGARPGDRVRPLGLDGRRKLQDIFVDRKVPAATRRSCPVVESHGEILWVPGLVRASQALITPTTSRALHLQARHPVIAGAEWLC